MFLIVKSLILFSFVLISVAFLTLAERKILGLIHLRLGPKKAVMYGIAQPLADAIKLFNKQVSLLKSISFKFLWLSSILTLTISLLLWNLVVINTPISSSKLSGLFILALMSINVFNYILASWSSFSKYSLIGGIRTVSQLISYEPLLFITFIFFFFLFKSFSLSNFLFYMSNLFVSLIIVLLIWIPTFLAELNRTPFDFSEGESELVGGFTTEFGEKVFIMIFISEYSNILFFSFISSFLFFFSDMYFLFLLISFFIIWIRSVLPRFRFDKLMFFSWKFFIPFISFLLILFMV